MEEVLEEVHPVPLLVLGDRIRPALVLGGQIRLLALALVKDRMVEVRLALILVRKSEAVQVIVYMDT